jgi:hypothetical protein
MTGKIISHLELTLNPSLEKRGTFASLLFLREGVRG